jgi:DNA-directed RNA polymerase subunit RPC12/RpoP
MGKYRCNRCTEEFRSDEKGRTEDCPFCGGQGTAKKVGKFIGEGAKVSMKEVVGKFREGTASHFNSLVVKWANANGLKVDWKFKEQRGKTESYFVITGKNYDDWDNQAILGLNHLVGQFNVDYKLAGNSVIVG